MKILLVSSKYQPEYSGSGLRAHNTYKRLEKKYGIEFDVIANSINHPGNEAYTYDGKKINKISFPYRVPKNKFFFRDFIIILSLIWEVFSSWIFIRKKIDEYDFIHTFGNSWTIGFLTWYFSRKNKPIIRELCNEMENPLYPIQFEKFIRPIFKKKNTLVVAISNRLEIIANDFGILNVWKRPNPIDESKYFVDYDNKIKFREKLTKFSENDIVLSLVANFIDRKNQIFAVDVLKKLPENYKLVLAGPLKDEGEHYFSKLKKHITDLELEDRVDIKTGFVGNFDEYLKCSDVFLFPSKAEGLGTPLLESQACGIPVVSNHIKGISDMVIKNGYGGFYLDMQPKEWAKAVDSALKISKDTLIENAQYIYDISSSKMIDEEYYKRFCGITNE